MKILKKDNVESSCSNHGAGRAPVAAPVWEEITRGAEELAAALDGVDWESEARDDGRKTAGSAPLQRLYDAVSAVKMNLDPFFGKRSHAERVNQVLFRISNAVNTTLNLDELYTSIHRSLGDILDVSNFYIALYDKKEDMLSFPYHIDDKTDFPICSMDKTRVKDSASLTGRIIRTGKPIFLTKDAIVRLYEREGKKPVGKMAEVWLGVPLTVGNDVIGAMVMQSYEDSELYDERDMDLLTSVSEQAAIAIQRKRAEEALQVEKAHIERLFDVVQEGIVMVDAAGVVLSVNPEFTRIFGYSVEEAAGSPLEDLIAPPDRIEEVRAFARRMARGEKVTFDAWRKRRDGSLINVSVIGAPIPLGADRMGQYTIYRDVTEQKRANSILLSLYNISKAVNSTKSLDELFELIHRSLGDIVDVSNFFIALYDRKRDIVTFPYFVDEKNDAVPLFEASQKKTSLSTKVIFQNKARFSNEAMLKRLVEREGDLVGPMPKVWVGVPLSIKGKVIGAVAVQSYTDPNLYSESDIVLLESVSEQIAIAIDSKRTEEALSESEKMYRTLFDNAGDAIFVHDMGRAFLDVNAVACERYGYKRDEFLQIPPAMLVPPEKRGRRAARLEQIRTLGLVIDEVEHMRRDGAPIHCELNSRLIEYKGKSAVLCIARDLTERKRAEEEKQRMAAQLQNARKMEAIGTLAGGVAHDLNNILSGLVSYPELLLMELPEESPMRNGILLIQQSGNRAAAIVQDLLTLARRGVVVTDVVDLNRILAAHLESPEFASLRSHHPHVRVETDLAPDLLNIRGSSVHLSKTVMNLVSNAAEAMPEGGVITISTENRYLDKPVKGYDDVRSGDYVTLTVSDQGIGIPPSDMERIFEPFYTKKEMGRSGTGLGMAVVWGTVKDHNGYIDIQSEEGEGSLFTLYFPMTREESEKKRVSLSMSDMMGRGEAVVAVDDVEEQRMILSGILKSLNYSAKMFPAGEEAVEYMKTHAADLLILDMIMDPGIDGLETYKRIIEHHPGQKAVIVSGFSETERVREAQRLGAGAYVKKPYLLKSIGLAMRKELEKPVIGDQ